MIEQFTETKLTIMLVAMNLALMDNLIDDKFQYKVTI